MVAALSTIAVACGGSNPILIDADASAEFSRPLTETVNNIDGRPLTGTTSNLIDDLDLETIEQQQKVLVTERRPHDPESFTQGLVFDNGRLFESRGLRGRSALTEIHPDNGQVLRQVNLHEDFFAEGLAVVDDRLIQLTWTSGIAFIYDLSSFDSIGEFTYEGEGWGLCYDGSDLWMSNGTDVLVRRDAQTFEALDQVNITLNGRGVNRLNELECVGGLIWANVWRTNTIVVIDPSTGEVVSSIDASGLLAPAEALFADALNGIAYDERRDSMVITGKEWPAMFEIELVPL